MKLSEIATALDCPYFGNDIEIERIGSLEKEYDNAIIYVEKKRYLETALSLKPAALLVGDNIKLDNMSYIQVEDPKLGFIKLLNLFNPNTAASAEKTEDVKLSGKAKIGSNVVFMQGVIVMDDASVDDNCIVYPGCIIEKNVKIGKNCIIYSGAIIRERCIIGDDCIIHSGAVIGSDGFGYYEKDGKNYKIPQIGDVKIGNEVEIGANTCIDRATIGTTEIGDETKLDNLVHIAHNVKIGKGCFFAAMVGVSGSVTIGDRVAIMGQVGIADHISIPDGTIVLGQSAVTNNLKKAEIYVGSPSRPVREHHKIHASLKYLPELLKRVKSLEKKLEGEES